MTITMCFEMVSHCILKENEKKEFLGRNNTVFDINLFVLWNIEEKEDTSK